MMCLPGYDAVPGKQNPPRYTGEALILNTANGLFHIFNYSRGIQKRYVNQEKNNIIFFIKINIYIAKS